MALNYKEIELILSESSLEGVKIQKVAQSSFRTIIWELYDRNRGRFSFYTEVGTPQSRLHVLSPGSKIPKTRKLQRFEQYARKNLEGSAIVSCRQLPFDRTVVWEINNHDRLLKVYFRFYSGPGANIIVTDENDIIQDLLLRRPGRREISSEKLQVEERTQTGSEFSVRQWEGPSFSLFIEKTCERQENESLHDMLAKQVGARMEHELSRIGKSLNSAVRTVSENAGYEELRYEADILSANSHLIKRGQDTLTVPDHVNGSGTLTIMLDKALSPGANVQACYEKYRRTKGAFENAVKERDRLKEEYKNTEERFSEALEESGDEEADIRRLKAILERTAPAPRIQEGPGIRTSSGGFQILAGRNAKENDELLRHHVKGNDMWLHTRDFPGGYVFIKFRRDKTIPLEVLLDAANIAVLYSKGRNSSSVNLYYTQVKYLRRVKDGKTGLVLPTQEKNLTIKPEPERIARLLPKEEK